MLVHMIFSAHLDPIWLWPWTSGLDEALATCRSACDRLDAHPDLVFTRAEAWVYQQVELHDPKLFERVRKHVKAGRWEITGGWWIQPDCNLPSGFALEQQIGIGKKYFLERFGVFPRVAYNVDTFGHAATLPGYLRAAGQDRYVMMRPQEHEMKLPARIFRWCGYEGGPEVVTFRIAGQYNSWKLSVDHVRTALTELPEGIEHTMCFAGLGDHGGGPTEKQIKWCQENENAIPGCRIVFSSPNRFFDAIAAQVPALPLVTGELQHHAIGCYSTYRPVKTGLRRAEHLLKQAEIVRSAAPQVDAGRLEKAWQYVCLHQFHDTLGGTCIPSAYPQVHAQLGFAEATGDEIIQSGLRLKMQELPDDKLQRIVLFNASDAPYDGYVECEPWLQYGHWSPTSELLGENGRPIPVQLLQPEAIVEWPRPHLLFRISLPPGKMAALRVKTDARPEAPAAKVSVLAGKISNDAGVAYSEGRLDFSAAGLAFCPRVDLIDDPSDTWTHRHAGYLEGPATSAQGNAPCALDSGPLMASLLQTGKVGNSLLRAEWRVYAGEPFVELRLNIHWLEKWKILKLTIPLPKPSSTRTDGILGGKLQRPNDARERPLRDWTRLDLGDGLGFGIVAPDVFALDASPQRVRLTLLRSAVMAHHEPHDGAAPRMTISDQGAHEFRFRFFCEKDLDPQRLDLHALMLQRPLLMADLTRGMPPLGQ